MIVFLSSTPLLYFLIVYQYVMHFSGSILPKRDTDWQTLLSVEGVLGEWLEVDVPEELFVLGVVLNHNSSTILYHYQIIRFLHQLSYSNNLIIEKILRLYILVHILGVYYKVVNTTLDKSVLQVVLLLLQLPSF